MNNEEILSHYEKRHVYEAARKFLKETINKYLQLSREIEGLLGVLHRISYFYNGVAIHRIKTSRKTTYYRPVDSNLTNSASIYLNAHNSKTWGLTITNRLGEKFWGADFTSRKKVYRLAIEWIIKGTVEGKEVKLGN